MPLPNGTRLGPYEIVSPIGAGGMGEVYLARDTRLERTVAIKVLPEALATDPDRLQRFEQEARTLSTVSHPNLLAIYDVGTQDATHYLVSEFLEGHTLRERMTGASLSQRRIADYALQLAEGLAAAHDKGIVHRDLKPENIFITNDERVKILDFGLAKQSPFVPTFGSGSGGSATITSPPATTPGTVMGTVGYMSPEQVRGGLVDQRSDIFSFGAILYETISGDRAFKGDSSVETMNAILKEDPPDVDPLQAKVSPAMNRIVRHCLEKNPANRFQSARDLGFALGALSGTDSSASAAATGSSPVRWWMIATGAALALAILSFVMFQSRGEPAGAAAERLEFAMPLQQEAGHLAISPDGRMLAFVTPDDSSGANVINVQRVGSSKVTVLTGTEGATYPFWSPDDSYVGFFADGKLKKIPAAGGPTQVLATAFAARGGSWGRRGVIVYSPMVAGWLWSVNADGSNAAPLTEKYFTKQTATSHRWPVFLPDGEHFLFWNGTFSNAVDDQKSGIYLSSVSGNESKQLISVHSNPGYANGQLYFVGEKQSLRAISFDVTKGTTSGEARVVAEGVGFYASTYWGAFGVGENGTVIYNTSTGGSTSVLTWLDRNGKELGRVGEPGVYANPHLSPDGNRVVLDVTDVKANNVDVWIKDLRHNTESRFTFDPAEDVGGIWSRDGSIIAYRSNQAQQTLYAKQALGLAAPKQLFHFQSGTNSNDLVPNSWSPGDKQILCSFQQISTGSALYLINVASGESSPFNASKASQTNGQISPDGKWVAYASNESGDWQVYVTTFPDAAGKWQVSRGGGREPRWRGDGKEIFYIGPKDMVTAVPVNDEGGFSSGNPTPLFQSHGRAQISSTDQFTYDVTKDGQRFLMNRYFKPEHIAPLQIILNAAAAPPK
ncbi:MAG: protein kinase [Acidobacteriota bacterium]|nr:protein kinase [Acidobacteriota bacterium]